MDRAQSQPWLRPRPQLAENLPWKFPAYQATTLSNGMTVWVFNMPGQHILDVKLVLSAPLSSEPANLQGVASLAAYLADEGTTAHPGSEISELLEAHGGAYSTTVSYPATTVTLTTPASRLAETLPLFSEIVLDGEYGDQDVALHCRLDLSQIDQLFSDPTWLATTALTQSLIERGHRAAGLSFGNRASLASITGANVRDFKTRRWTPNGAVLVIAGEIAADPLPLVEKYFSQWTGLPPTPPEPIRPASDTHAGREVLLLDRPESVQADIRVGCYGIGRTHPLWASLRVAVAAVGGSFSSRLNSVLREDKGYTYGASLSARPLLNDGLVTMGTSVRTEVVADALNLAHTILALEHPLDEAEVWDAKQFILGSAPLSYDVAEAIAAQAGTLAAVGLRPEFLNKYFADTHECSAEQANHAYLSVINPDKLLTVVVGQAAAIIPQLAESGWNIKLIDSEYLNV